MEITKKVLEVVLFKENAYKGNNSYNITLENDSNRYSYLCQGEAKIKVGDTGPFIVEEKTAGANKWWTIKLPKAEFGGGGGGWKPKANNLIALEWARKMFNSSYETKDKWTMKKMLDTATYLNNRLESGTNKDAIETATIIACATAMSGTSMDAAILVANIAEIEAWINGSK